MLCFRIIDVNANRAREASRVIEDYARFILEDSDLSARARSIRHQLVNILKPCVRQMLASRDIQSDIGKETKTSAKTTPEIIISNLRRLSESLRSISEYLKIQLPALVAKVERLRFEAYQLEQELFFILYPNKAFDKVRLYVLVPSIRNDKIVRDLIKGGVGPVRSPSHRDNGRCLGHLTSNGISTLDPFDCAQGQELYGERSRTISTLDMRVLIFI